MLILQILAICGMFSPIVYTAMWIYCGSLDSDYSHIRDDISSLFAVGAPNRRLAKSFIIISSVLLFVFYFTLFFLEGAIVGSVLLLISSILGILVAFFFPLDEGGEFTTLRGKMHLILVVISGILTIAGMIALWARLQFIADWSAFATYSLISAIVSFILIIISGIFATGKYRGILERIGVSPYQIYYFVLSLMVFLNN